MVLARGDVIVGRGDVGESPIEAIGKLPTLAVGRLLVSSIEKLPTLTVGTLPI